MAITLFSNGSVTVIFVSAVAPRLVTTPVKMTVCPFSMIWGLQFFVMPSSGTLVSCTVMVWLHVLELLQVSMAAHIRVAEKEFPQIGLVVVFRTTIRLVPQESAGAEGGSNAHGLPRLTVLLVAQKMAGPV